jgi:RNA polymerase sigma-70 factor, ECF subfamily
VKCVTDVDDRELMLRYAQGDTRAFEALYGRHRQPLYRYLVRLSGDTATAQDLFQEVWLRVIASRNRYEPRAPFAPFLFRIAYNCCVDHGRRRRTRAEIPQSEPQEWLSRAPASTEPDSAAANAQLRARLQAAVAALPAEQRDVFLLYEESGLSLEQIASITDVPTETAKSRLRYAVNKLRSALSGVWSAERAASRSASERAEEPSS